MSLTTTAFSSATRRPCLHTLRPGRSIASAGARRTVVAHGSQGATDQLAIQDGARLFDRRSLMFAAGTAVGLAPWLPAVASEGAGTSLTSYTDPQDNFTVTVPAGWEFGEGFISGNSSFSGASGARRTLAWFPEGANARDVNVTLVITNVSVEFTKLGSFGTPYQFGSSLVNSQDRSYLLRGPEWARGREPVMVAKLVDAAEVSNKYFIEYTVQKVPEPQRHLYSMLALGYNGMYNRLYTITAQTLEGDREKYEATLLSMVKSLTVPPQRV